MSPEAYADETVRGLLAGIREEPDDLTRYLVWADRLNELGGNLVDARRAELVRLQVERAFARCPECGGRDLDVGPCGLTNYYRACESCRRARDEIQRIVTVYDDLWLRAGPRCAQCAGLGYRSVQRPTPNPGYSPLTTETVRDPCYRCHGWGDAGGLTGERDGRTHDRGDVFFECGLKVLATTDAGLQTETPLDLDIPSRWIRLVCHYHVDLIEIRLPFTIYTAPGRTWCETAYDQVPDHVLRHVRVTQDGVTVVESGGVYRHARGTDPERVRTEVGRAVVRWVRAYNAKKGVPSWPPPS